MPGLLKETESAMPVVATAQLVVASRRVRQILLRYISPLYRCASMPSSVGLNGFSCLGFSDALISLASFGMTLRDSGGKPHPVCGNTDKAVNAIPGASFLPVPK